VIADDVVARFTAVIELRFGLRSDRPAMTGDLLARRAARRGETPGAYVLQVEAGDADELRALATELSVGETYFFRHAEQCHAFADLLPSLHAQRGHVRVLSAGCASGEEPYTLAMLVRERIGEHAAAIHAFDMNPAAIERAKRARYTRWAMRATPPEIEQRWFVPTGRELELDPAIRAAVTFEEGNLLDDRGWARATWDVIFCRNVTMYFSDARSREVIARLVRALAPGGYLFLGHAETLRDRADLELCHDHGTFYYRRAGGGTAALAPTPARVAVAADAGAWADDIASASRRVSALVDDALARPAPVPVTLDPIRDLVASERFADARAALARLPASVRAGAGAMLLDAIVHAQTGAVAGAEAICHELLARDARDAAAHYVLAICRDSAGDVAASERHARDALASDPTFAMAGVQLAFLAKRAGDRVGLGAQLERAIELIEAEPAPRLALFAGGFSRRALIALCRAELGAMRAS
jgi:chemotaxis protein methyltransferase CheR